MALKGCIPWNKGIDQRTGLPPDGRRSARWETFRRRVRKALERGYLTRPAICTRCNQEAFTHAFPLAGDDIFNIEWLCSACSPRGQVLGRKQRASKR